MTHYRNIKYLIVVVFLAFGVGFLFLPTGASSEEASPDHLEFVVATDTTETTVDATTTTVAPTTTTTVVTTTTAASTTTAPTTTTAPVLPQAPACSTWGSQDEVNAWMASNADTHDTSNIDTNGDGVACTLSFTPEPAPTWPPAPTAPNVSSSGRCGGGLPPCFVMDRESGGDPRIWNGGCYASVGHRGLSPCGISDASGKWQFLRSTWGGYGGYVNAADAPEYVQDQKARQLWAGGSGCYHWNAC